jgi:DHA2 family multidrug resistance protein
LAIKQATNHFISTGMGTVDAQRRAVALIGQTITSQVAILSYIDVFFALGVLALCMTPIPFLLKSTTGSRKPATG